MGEVVLSYGLMLLRHSLTYIYTDNDYMLIVIQNPNDSA